MPIPKGWSVQFQRPNANIVNVADPRAICPHCASASTFQVMFQNVEMNGPVARFHLVMRCNYAACKKVVIVDSSVDMGVGHQQTSDPFFMYPSGAIEPPHPGVPVNIADDWVGAQRSFQASAPEAAAVMLRRVLYDVLLDKGCKLHPIKAASRN